MPGQISCILLTTMKRIVISTACASLLLVAGCSSVSRRLLADDPQVRAAALDEVLRSGEKTRRKTVLRMKKILGRRNSPNRLYAVSALEDLGQSAAPAIPELIAALTGGDLVSSSAARALSKLDAAAPALAEALKSKDPALRLEAARILPAYGAPAAQLLAKNLESPDSDLAERSARILGETGPAARDAVPALARAAFSGQKDLKLIASASLVKIGAPAGAWLAAALRAREPKIRFGAARVLTGMRPPSPEAAEQLAAALEDSDAVVRAAAAEALASYPREVQAQFPENIISALYHAAQTPDEAARSWASMALVKSGSNAANWLVKALKDPVPAARAGAALVISRMLPPPAGAADAVLAALKDPDPDVRIAAADALGNYIGTAAASLPKTAGGDAAEAMKDKDPELRSALIFPLGRLAFKSRKAAAALIAALKDSSLEVRKGAASALGALGPAAKKAVPALAENLKDRDCALRALSAAALIAIDPAFKKNTAALRAAKKICSGVKTNPRIDPVAAAAEKLTGSATGQFPLPVEE